MSWTFCSIGSLTMPIPTMLSMANTRVRARSTTRFRKSSKLRQPELPTSTIVVTPERKLNPSGSTLLSPAHASRSPVVA
jgi:hypothetical protein